MRIQLLAMAMILTAFNAGAAERHQVQGILVKVEPSRRMILVSCDAIPGFMEAMVMPFTVHGSADLKDLAPGSAVHFDMVEKGGAEYAENLRVVEVSNYDSEPTEAGRLTFLQRSLDPLAKEMIVQTGQPVPDFTLTDQARQPTRLSQFKGKVVALTFAYSRCPNPNYCFRLSNNLAQLERSFRGSSGRELILMTIVIDPAQDRGKALERYADTWNANPSAWRFLTGSLDDVRNVAAEFGMNFWKDEGFLTHSFHTVVIDREGRLAANLEGNQFSAQQLGDVVESVLHKSAPHVSSAVSKLEADLNAR